MKSGGTDLSRTLAEREKELDALYKLAVIFARPATDIHEVLRETADILRSSMQFPEHAKIRIWTEEHHIGDDLPCDPADFYQIERTVSKDMCLTVTAGYHGTRKNRSSALIIEEREKHLIDAIASLLTEVLQRSAMEEALRGSAKALQRQADEMENKNVALREMLYQIDAEKRQIFSGFRTRADMFVRPYLHKLKNSSTSTEEDRLCVAQIEKGLELLLSEAQDTVIRLADKLTPREVEVCTLIKSGLLSKEIASFLHISETTVERHRNTIRKKLALTKRKVNLTSYLRGLP